MDSSAATSQSCQTNETRHREAATSLKALNERTTATCWTATLKDERRQLQSFCIVWSSLLFGWKYIRLQTSCFKAASGEQEDSELCQCDTCQLRCSKHRTDLFIIWIQRDQNNMVKISTLLYWTKHEWIHEQTSDMSDCWLWLLTSFMV